MTEQSQELWPGRYEVKATVTDIDGEGNTGHVVFWRFMDDNEIAALYAELGQPMPADSYEASQVGDTFSAEEVEALRAYYANDPNTKLEILPATKPLSGPQVNEKGETYNPCGIAPFGDMYSGWIDLEEVKTGLHGSVTHLTAAVDGLDFSWDATRPNGYARAKYELEQKRRKLAGGNGGHQPVFPCPQCSREMNHYRNYDRNHYGVCLNCGIYFWIGSNLFSSWKEETQEDWDKNAAYLSQLTRRDEKAPDEIAF